MHLQEEHVQANTNILYPIAYTVYKKKIVVYCVNNGVLVRSTVVVDIVYAFMTESVQSDSPL